MKIKHILTTNLNEPDDDRAEACMELANVKLVVNNVAAFNIVDMEVDGDILCIGVKSVVEPINEHWLSEKLYDIFDEED